MAKGQGVTFTIYENVLTHQYGLAYDVADGRPVSLTVMEDRGTLGFRSLRDGPSKAFFTTGDASTQTSLMLYRSTLLLDGTPTNASEAWSLYKNQPFPIVLFEHNGTTYSTESVLTMKLGNAEFYQPLSQEIEGMDFSLSYNVTILETFSEQPNQLPNVGC